MKTLNTLLEIMLYSAILYAAILLLKRCFKNKLSPFLHFAVWGLLVARLLVPITLESSVHLFVLPVETQIAATTEQIQPQATQSIDVLAVASNAQVTQPQTPNAQQMQTAAAPTTVPAANKSTGLSLQQIILILWLAGVGIGLLYLLVLHVALRRKILRNTEPSSPRLRVLFEEVKAELGVRSDVKLLSQYEYGTPALLFPKTVLLPIDALVTMDDEQVKFTLRHELTHFKRGDQITSLLLSVLNAVYWFNPVVWIAFPQIRTDIETACDSAVVRRLDRAQRSRYAALVVSLFARPQHRQLALGMAQGDTKKMAERRVRGIYMQSKSGRSAKLVSAALAVVLLVGCFTTACQPTPTKPAVVGKDGNKLEEIIKSTQGAYGAIQTPAFSVYKTFFRGADEAVTIGIDADVHTPGGNMPVIDVKPHAITKEQVMAMANVLFQGEIAYEPQIGLTKADLQQRILGLKKQIADDKVLMESSGNDRKTADTVKAGYERQIAEYEKQLPSAPESIKQRETDWNFHPESFYMDLIQGGIPPGGDAQSMAQYYNADTIMLSSTVQGYRAAIQVSNLETDIDVQHLVQFSMGSNVAGSFAFWNSEDSKPMPMTRTDAVAMVTAALQKMGITNMCLYECRAYAKPQISPAPTNARDALDIAAGQSTVASQPTEPPDGEAYSYSLTFVPSFEGVSSVVTSQYIEDSMDPYGPTYFYEQLHVNVANSMITSLDWNSPLEQVRVENGSVPVLSLDEAAAVFKKQMQQEYTLAKLSGIAKEYGDYEKYAGRIESVRINITDIRLGLMRVRIKDKPGAYRMVPAWTFAGTEQFVIKGQQTPMQSPRTTNGAYTYSVINAIDGSIIDPSKGY